MSRPILFVIAGPNGAGKTTFYKTHLAPLTAAPFINADDIQRNELTDQSVEAAYQAAAIAEYRRDQHLAARQSFITETVFSHPSKLVLIQHAKEQGFETRVFMWESKTPIYPLHVWPNG
ncbi:zeta toxin family protein [Nitrospira sp. M1]